jgi:hypothetical protein
MSATDYLLHEWAGPSRDKAPDETTAIDLGEFFEVNADLDEGTKRAIKELAPGGRYDAGGGAQPLWTVERLGAPRARCKVCGQRAAIDAAGCTHRGCGGLFVADGSRP